MGFDNQLSIIKTVFLLLNQGRWGYTRYKIKILCLNLIYSCTVIISKKSTKWKSPPKNRAKKHILQRCSENDYLYNRATL